MEPTDLLNQNRLLFTEMKKLATKQEELILKDQVVAFLKISNRREHVKREISKNNEQYGSIIKKGSSKSLKNSQDMLNREISDLIRSIQEVDRRVEKMILEKRDQLIQDARNLKTGKKALKGYGKKAPDIPRFLSRKG